MFDDMPDLPTREIKVKRSKFSKGIENPLKAKSHSGSGSELYDHLLQAGRMSLTVSETIEIDKNMRENLRRCSFIGGIFHDLGKSAAGFQEMIKDYNVKGWDPKNPGYRHEMMSAMLFISNSIDKTVWNRNKLLFQSVYLSIIVHHKPFKAKGPDNYPKKIKISQWPMNQDFLIMFEELKLNKKLLTQTWTKIISEIENDSWGTTLIEEGWIPKKLRIPKDKKELETIYYKFDNNFTIKGYSNGNIDSFIFKSNHSQEQIKFLSYVRAAVTVGDHLSSGNYLFLPAIPYLKKYDVYEKFNPRNFQIKCSEHKGNLLLRAPTGSGKTQAAMSWIQNNQLTKDKKLGKVFFVLPYQASLNAMYNRIAEWINVKHGLVGLQHSRAAQVLFGQIEQELYKNKNQNDVIKKKEVIPFHDPWSEIDEIKTINQDKFSDLLLYDGYGRNYWSSPVKKQINTAASQLDRLTRESFYPLKVTTPHQLLGSLLQGRGWEVSIQEFEQSCFVFDEIHVYDVHLMGLILGMAKVLINEFNAKILFMSASFPTFLINKIRELVDTSIPLLELDGTETSDSEVLTKERHVIKLDEKTVLELLGERSMIEYMIKKSSVLIICNTVNIAQEVYETLQSHDLIKEEEVLLFHSKFNMEDRKVKENKIIEISNDETLKFIVATQVVEVSLDIDLEFGIIEGAPLDALVQRFGRINRAGNNQNLEKHNIIVTQPSGSWNYVYEEKITEFTLELLKEVENQRITETKLVELIDELYDTIGWTETDKANFEIAFGHEKYQNLFNKVLPGTYSNWIDDVITNNSTIDVLHPNHLDQYKERLKHTPIKALDLLIPARISKSEYYHDYKLGINILNNNWLYDPEIGLRKEENNK